MAQAHALSWDEAWKIRRRGRGVRVHDAHEFLHRLRISQVSWSAGVDLTHSALFDWRGYLANHSDEWLECIFGDEPAESQESWRRRNRGRRRIVKFEARFLRFWDEETAGPRFDFIAHRDDGLHFRLHPGMTGATETWPIPGDVRSWAVEDGAGSALAANPSPAASQEPFVTDGRDFLQRQVQAWEHHPRRRFTRNLTPGTAFAWDLFLHRGDANAKRLIQRGVVECWLVWVGRVWQRAAFYFRFHDGAETVYYYATTNDGRWVSDERLVEDIYWPA